MATKFHLGWFMNFKPPRWTGPMSGDVARTWMDGSFHIEMAQSLERAGFDYMILEDSSKVPDAYRGTSEAELKYAEFAPKHDPFHLAALLASNTSRIGLVATASTSFYPPFLLARAMATLDHISHGRIGWNIVTSSGDRAAQNFNLDEHYEHDSRYDRADEFTEVACRLWDSWEAGAVVADRDTGRYADHERVRTIDFEGRYYRSRGPLNVPRSPQGRPVLSQAGGSRAGMDFAAKYAEAIIAVPLTVDAMRAFREDMHQRMQVHGRAPGDCKMMFVKQPIVAATEYEAKARFEAMRNPTASQLESSLSHLSTHTEIDFSRFDLDEPLPRDLTTNGHQTSLASLYHMGGTVREVATTWLHHYVDETMVGTPDQVARRMGEVIEEVGGDGYLISGPVSRQYIHEIADGLAPALKARGLTRTTYKHERFRDNLLEF